MPTTLVKSRGSKTGLPPGTPIHIGERRLQDPVVTLMEYGPDDVAERAIVPPACPEVAGGAPVRWINVEGVGDLGLLKGFAEHYGIHPLVLEDIVNTDQRPKREDYGDYLFIVVKMLSCSPESGKIRTEQVSIILGNDYVLSLQEGLGGDVLDPLRDRIRNGRGTIRKMGADYLAYSILDAVVDNYFVVLERIADRIEELETALVRTADRELLRKLHSLKREMLFLRKAVWPLREVVSGLERRESPLIAESTALYLRDLYDHTAQVIDMIETFREMLSGMVDIYLSSVANRTNEVMKVLTIIATFFMPLTFIVGIYGMNFRSMPELESRWGYPAVWIVMIATTAVMYLFFRRKKWF
jgi:magnesium transporter